MTISDSAASNRLRARRAPQVELRGGPAWADESDYRAVERAPRATESVYVGADGFLTGDVTGDVEPDYGELEAALSDIGAVEPDMGHEPVAPQPARAEQARAETVRPEAVRRNPAGPHPSAPHPSAPRPTGNRGSYADSRTLADFERARRHSRVVSFLKIGLPSFAVLAVIAILAAPLLSGVNLPSVEIGSTKIEDGKLVMDNPKLKGTDSSQRPYDLTARRAIQDADHPTRITLEQIDARLPMSDTAFAKVTAGTGVYDADGKTLRLGDEVAVDTEDGMSIRMQDAAIDIASGSMSTLNPVAVDTGRAYVSADTLSVEDKGSRIVFKDRVRMTIRPASETGTGRMVAIPTMPIIGEIGSQGEDGSSGDSNSPGKAAE